MNLINYDNRIFAASENSANGETDRATIFHYHQQENIVWATYSGGKVVFGTLVAKVDAEDNLDMRYQHINDCGEIMTGECKSAPEILSDGRLRLRETWRWKSGDFSQGSSVLEEIERPEINRRS